MSLDDWNQCKRKAFIGSEVDADDRRMRWLRDQMLVRIGIDLGAISTPYINLLVTREQDCQLYRETFDPYCGEMVHLTLEIPENKLLEYSNTEFKICEEFFPIDCWDIIFEMNRIKREEHQIFACTGQLLFDRVIDITHFNSLDGIILDHEISSESDTLDVDSLITTLDHQDDIQMLYEIAKLTP